MCSWPHAPCHRFNSAGTYMVTGSTFNKQHLFRTFDDLDLLQKIFFELAEKYQWKLEAWALFSNHYHFIARSPENPNNLSPFMRHFHSSTARALNDLHQVPGRVVWYQYWDTQLTYYASYLARLNYVMQNPVKHGRVSAAEMYPWCSIHWFKQHSSSVQRAIVTNMKIDMVNVYDDF